MKVKYQLFFSMILVVSIGFFAGGAFFLYGNFRGNLQSRVEHANQQHYTAQYFYELRLSGNTAGADSLSPEDLIAAAADVASELPWGDLTLCVSQMKEAGAVHLYSDLPARIGRQDLLDTIGADPIGKIVLHGDDYDLLVTTSATWRGTTFFFTTAHSVTSVYEELNAQTRNLLLIWMGMLLPLGAAALTVSGSISRRIEELEKTAGHISSGAYGERTVVAGDDEIARLGISFNRMADSVEKTLDELQDYAKSRDDFARNFSHELKTPLTSIIGYAELLRTQPCGEAVIQEAAGYIFREGKRLEVLSRRLLELMKLRQTRLKLTIHPLGPILFQLKESVIPLCRKNGVRLAVPDCNGTAAFDPTLFLTLLTNLVNNAQAACENGGLVELTLKEQESRWIITVRDNGKGIPAEKIPRLTEEFYQIDQARNSGGIGLGLSICQEIARLHGGSLSIQSVPGKGTDVSFSLQKGVPL